MRRDPFTRKRFAMRDTKTNQEVAKEFARMRARDIEQVERLPPAPSGQWYCKRRGVRGEDEWRLEPALLVCGSVAVVNHGAFTLIDRSGLRMTGFYERSDAERLARAVGKSIERTFARSATGNALAMRALFRLCEMHKRAAQRRGPTGKLWTKRELKALDIAEQWGSRRGKVGTGVGPERAREILVLVGLSECNSFPDDKLRHWYMRLLARVEREGLPT